MVQSSLRDETGGCGSVRRGGWVETHGYQRLTLCGRNDGWREPADFIAVSASQHFSQLERDRRHQTE